MVHSPKAVAIIMLSFLIHFFPYAASSAEKLKRCVVIRYTSTLPESKETCRNTSCCLERTCRHTRIHGIFFGCLSLPLSKQTFLETFCHPSNLNANRPRHTADRQSTDAVESYDESLKRISLCAYLAGHAMAAG